MEMTHIEYVLVLRGRERVTTTRAQSVKLMMDWVSHEREKLMFKLSSLPRCNVLSIPSNESIGTLPMKAFVRNDRYAPCAHCVSFYMIVIIGL